MKGHRLVCFTAVIALSEVLVIAHAYGTSSSGRVTTTESSLEHHGHGDGEDQWGGPPEHAGNHHQQGQSGERDQHGQQPSHQVSGQNRINSDQPNAFSRSSYVEKYGSPEGCVDHEDPRKVCSYYVEISKVPEYPRHVYFELFRHIPEPNKGGWVAVGLSEDKFMGEDDMVECVVSGGGQNVRMYHSWALERGQPKRIPEDPHVIIQEDNYPQYNAYEKSLTCKFKRPIESSVEVPGRPPVTINLERGQYHILLAEGNIQGGNSDQLGYHGDKPLGTGKAYVSDNLLGHKDLSGKPGHGRSSGNSGQTIGSVVFVLLYGFLRLVY